MSKTLNPLFILIIVVALLTACSTAPRYGPGTPKRATTTKQGKKRYQKVQYGISSFYGEDFHGKTTANGEVFDMYGLTAAHKTLPLNTIIRVTNLENDKSLILRINDRGPFVKGRILDCSYGAALKLGFVGQGTTRVKIEVIELGDNEYMKRKS